MNTHLLCFANRRFRAGNAWLQASARRFGIGTIHAYNDRDFLRTDFARSHADIASEAFGVGFYLWKPYYILQTLQSIPEGDLLLYADSGQVLVADPAPLFEIGALNGIVLFANTQGYSFFHRTGLPFTAYNCYEEVNKTKYWTKGDAFVISGMDSDRHRESWLVDASLLLLRNDNRSRDMVRRWLKLCSDRRALSWDPNVLSRPNEPGFQFHIYDQSLLSLLAADENISLHRCPSQYGNHYKSPAHRVAGEWLLLPYAEQPWPESDYRTLTHHHRYKRQSAGWRWKRYLYRELALANAYLLDNRVEWINSMFNTPEYEAF